MTVWRIQPACDNTAMSLISVSARASEADCGHICLADTDNRKRPRPVAERKCMPLLLWQKCKAVLQKQPLLHNGQRCPFSCRGSKGLTYRSAYAAVQSGRFRSVRWTCQLTTGWPTNDHRWIGDVDQLPRRDQVKVNDRAPGDISKWRRGTAARCMKTKRCSRRNGHEERSHESRDNCHWRLVRW